MTLAWPCGQPTCTGQCELFRIPLRAGPRLRDPLARRRPDGAGTISPPGYVLVQLGGTQRKLHRLVAELAFGATLKPSQNVHHRDGNKLNNCPPNLVILDHGEHAAHHHVALRRTDGRVPVRCPFCSKSFLPFHTTSDGCIYCTRACFMADRRREPRIPPSDPADSWKSQAPRPGPFIGCRRRLRAKAEGRMQNEERPGEATA